MEAIGGAKPHNHSISAELDTTQVHQISDMLWATLKINGEYKPTQVTESFYESLAAEERLKWEDPRADSMAAEDAAAATRAAAAATADDDANNEDVPPPPRVAAVPAVTSATAAAAGPAGGVKRKNLMSAVKLIKDKVQKLMASLEDLSVGNDCSPLGARAASLNFPRLEIDDTGKATLFGFGSLKELSAKRVLGSLLLMTDDVIIKMNLTTVYELDRCAAELRYKMKKNGIMVLMADFAHPNMINVLEGTLGFDDMDAAFARAFNLFKSTQGEPADVVQDWFHTFVKLMVFFISQAEAEEEAEFVRPTPPPPPPNILLFRCFLFI
jgi:hypothetical protein